MCQLQMIFPDLSVAAISAFPTFLPAVKEIMSPSSFTSVMTPTDVCQTSFAPAGDSVDGALRPATVFPFPHTVALMIAR